MSEHKKFYETDIWKEAYELQKEVFELANQFPKEERYGLTSQVCNSSNSVVANIAESHGRYHFADKIRVLYIVRGELCETQSHMMVAVSRNYVTKHIVTVLIGKYEALKIKLSNMISSYRTQKEKDE